MGSSLRLTAKSNGPHCRQMKTSRNRKESNHKNSQSQRFAITKAHNHAEAVRARGRCAHGRAQTLSMDCPVAERGRQRWTKMVPPARCGERRRATKVRSARQRRRCRCNASIRAVNEPIHTTIAELCARVAMGAALEALAQRGAQRAGTCRQVVGLREGGARHARSRGRLFGIGSHGTGPY